MGGRVSTPRRIGAAALLTVMVAAGWYVFVYLYRWEWNRALVSGIIFLAAEIALLGALVLERLAQLKRRLARLDAAPNGERVLRRLRERAPAPASPFAWLERQQPNVFVPVLLGAGVVLSAVAWVVDRLARLIAVPTMERGLARKLDHAAAGARRSPRGAADRPVRTPMKPLLVVVALALAGFVAVGELGDLTQSRPDPVRDDAATELVLSVDEERFGPGEAGAAAALWAVCSAQTRSAQPAGFSRSARGATASCSRRPSGTTSSVKLVGCLEDLTIDRVVGDVESFRTFSLPG